MSALVKAGILEGFECKIGARGVFFEPSFKVLEEEVVVFSL